VKIPNWGRGISGKIPGWKQVHQRVLKILKEFLAVKGDYPGKLLPANRYTN
jgi:hypothetical protein